MSNEKNINTNVEKKDATAVAHEIKGELTYEDKVIQKIIGLSLENVSGLLGIDGGFFSNLKEKIVNSDEYQKNVPALYSEIREIVSSEVAKMTDLEVVEINVNVVDIKTKEQHEADSVSLQDRVSDVAESTGEFASEQFEKAKSGLGSGFSTVQEKVSEGVEAVKGAATGVVSHEKTRVN